MIRAELYGGPLDGEAMWYWDAPPLQLEYERGSETHVIADGQCVERSLVLSKNVVYKLTAFHRFDYEP